MRRGGERYVHAIQGRGQEDRKLVQNMEKLP